MLKHFRNSEYIVTEDVIHHLEYQRGELLTIEQFEDIREKDGQIECIAKRKGFDDNESGRLSAELLNEDVPDLYKEYLEELRKNGTNLQHDIANQLV